MRLSPGGIGVVRGISAGLFVMALLTAGLQAQKNAPKPDPKVDAAAQAQAMAQQQEIQTLVRLADSAMSGQTAPADFPIQFQNDFLKAQGSRVWVPMTRRELLEESPLAMRLTGVISNSGFPG